MAWTERYVRADAVGGGDGTTDTNSGANGAWTMAEAVAALATPSANTRVNVKSGTYNLGTADFTFSCVGSSTTVVWWRGFNSTPGDLDNVSVTTNFPYLYVSSGGSEFHLSCTYNWFSNLFFEAYRHTGSRAIVNLAGTNNYIRRCKVLYGGDNLTTTPTCLTIGSAGDRSIVAECWIDGNGVSTRGIRVDANGPGAVFGNRIFNIDGNGIHFTDSNVHIYRNIIRQATIGIKQSGSGVTGGGILFNTIYDIDSDGISFDSTSGGVLVAGNLLHTIGGDGINATAATSLPFIIGNGYYLITGNQVGTNICEQQQFKAISCGSSPLVDPANDDFTPQGDALLVAPFNEFFGLPNTFGYMALGAVQIGA